MANLSHPDIWKPKGTNKWMTKKEMDKIKEKRDTNEEKSRFWDKFKRNSSKLN